MKLSALPDVQTPTAEEYWPDIEGLDHRDTVTDFSFPEGTFFDCALVHLVTTATLDRLRELYPQGRFEVRRFRPNIVVETARGAKDFVENAWIGQTLTLANAVRLGITGPCARCVMTTLPQGDLPKDAGILRAAAQHNRANIGVYASILRGGKIRRRESARILSSTPQVKKPVRPCSLKGILHHEESAMVGVGDPNLTPVVRRRGVRSFGSLNRAKQARLPARGDSDDGQRSLLRVGHIDMPEGRVVSDQVGALSNLESTKDPSVVGHVKHCDASSAGADKKPRFGFV